jgi:hypothetical protein
MANGLGFTVSDHSAHSINTTNARRLMPTNFHVFPKPKNN